MTDNNKGLTEGAPPLNTKVPADWHGDMVRLPYKDVMSVDGTVGSTFLANAGSAMDGLYKEYGDMVDAQTAAINATPPEYAKQYMPKGSPYPAIIPDEALRLGKALEASFNRAAARFDGHIKALQVYRDKMQDALKARTVDKKMDEPPGVAMASEVRALVRSMPKPERLGFVAGQVRERDRLVALAVLNAPAVLSGLTKEEHGILRTQVNKEFAPVDSDQVRAADEILAKLERAAKSFAEHYTRLRPPIDKKRVASNDAITRLERGG